MVFFEAVHALLSLDFGFFIDVVMNNLLWVAIFAAMIHFFFDGKRLVYWFTLWGIDLWAIISWEQFTGMAFSGASFLMVYYISKLAVLSIAENTPSLKKYMVVISTVQAYTMIILFSFLFGGG